MNLTMHPLTLRSPVQASFAIQLMFMEVIADARASNTSDTFWLTLDGQEYIVTAGPTSVTVPGGTFTQVEGTWVLTLGSLIRLQVPLSVIQSEACVCTADGRARGTKTGSVSVAGGRFQAHHSDVTSLCFFPSGQVLLSAGDLRARVWALDGTCARTFSGHTGLVTAAVPVGRGRNVLTASKDGSVRMWECGLEKQVAEFRRVGGLTDGVNALVVATAGSPAEPAAALTNPLAEPAAPAAFNQLDFETSNKHLFAGHESGVIQHYTIGDRRLAFSFPSIDGAAVTALAGNPDDDGSVCGRAASGYALFAGYANGILRVWLPGCSTPAQTYKLSDEPVRSVAWGRDLVVACGVDLLRVDAAAAVRGEWRLVWLLGAVDAWVVTLVVQGQTIIAVGEGTEATYR